MIAFIAVASMLAVVSLWVVLPLVREAGGEAVSTSDEARERLLEDKHAAYMAILDLENDRALGKVSDEDFQVLRRRHEMQALRALRALDHLATPESTAETIEREIAAARRRLRDDP